MMHCLHAVKSALRRTGRLLSISSELETGMMTGRSLAADVVVDVVALIPQAGAERSSHVMSTVSGTNI